MVRVTPVRIACMVSVIFHQERSFVSRDFETTISSSQTSRVCVVGTAVVGGIVVLYGTTRRLVSLFFDVPTVSLLCPGLGTVRITIPSRNVLPGPKLQATLTTSCTRTQYSCKTLWKIPFQDPKDNWCSSATAGRRGHVTCLATISRVQQRRKASRKASNTQYAYLVILLNRDNAKCWWAVTNLVNLDD